MLLGMNAHINFDLPQSLIRMIPPEDFRSPGLLDLRRRDHERIDEVLAARVGEEDVALQRAGGRRTPLDRVLAPANRQASRLFLRESRRKVWANTGALHAARLRGPAAYADRLVRPRGGQRRPGARPAAARAGAPAPGRPRLRRHAAGRLSTPARRSRLLELRR